MLFRQPANYNLPLQNHPRNKGGQFARNGGQYRRNTQLDIPAHPDPPERAVAAVLGLGLAACGWIRAGERDANRPPKGAVLRRANRGLRGGDCGHQQYPGDAHSLCRARAMDGISPTGSVPICAGFHAFAGD